MSIRVLIAVLVLSVGQAAWSEPLPAAHGDILLTVTGAIANTNDGADAVFDRDLLRAFGDDEITTSTIWTEGTHVFRGISIYRLLILVGAEGDTFEARALNDYRIKIPVSDATENGPIIAYEMDGEPMSIRDKGPLWIVFPYDENPDYQSEVTYSRSVWQLARLEVLD